MEERKTLETEILSLKTVAKDGNKLFFNLREVLNLFGLTVILNT